VALAADASGAVLLATSFGDTLEVAGTTVSAPSSGAVLVAKLDPSAGLTPTWTKVFSPAINVGGLIVDPCGDTIMTGSALELDLFWARLGP
jgi:hypothetical protein